MDNVANLIKNTKFSRGYYIVIFIVGMVIPGACSLAIYDINLFFRLDLIRLTILSIGISSPALLFSTILLSPFLLDSKIMKLDEEHKDNIRNQLIENIFLLSCTLALSALIVCVLYHIISGYPLIEVYTIYLFLIFLCVVILHSINFIKPKWQSRKKHTSNQWVYRKTIHTNTQVYHKTYFL